MQAELASVQAAARQIVDTQQDLVDAIRLEFDDTRPTPRTVRADDLISRAIKTNRVLATNIALRGAPSRLAFTADERWAERILNNLVSNAIWHSGADQILVGARRRSDDIVFEVRDNGRGMTPDKVERVFEPLKLPAFSPAGYSVTRSGMSLHPTVHGRMGGVECRWCRAWDAVPGAVAGLFWRSTGGHSIRPRRSPQSTRNHIIAILDDDEQVLQRPGAFFELGIESMQTVIHCAG
jgi:hypothetical protein